MFIQYSEIGTIFDYLSLGVIVLSRDRRILEMNASAEALTGVRAETVTGKFCYEIFLDYLCGGRCKYLESPDAERETVVSEIEITDQQNKTCSITKIESPVYNPQGQITGCIEVFQDHSAFRELIKRVRFDDLRLRIILDNLSIGILTVDRGNHISFFNHKAEELTGISRSEILGKPCKRIFGRNFCQEFQRQKKAATEGNHKIRIETDLLTVGGDAIPIQADYMPLKNEEGQTVGGLTTMTDLSMKYQLHRAMENRYTFHDMVGKHPDMKKIFEILPVVSTSDATVLIEGPTGTGKDLLAKIIHSLSDRGGRKMIKVNCASLPDNLLESEMFGYVRGAFTGADRDKPGRFQLADNSTIFLDEIGDLPLSLQAKLLRVLEDKEFFPLGSRETTRVDVRIISATNQNLKQQVREKRFREDLYYRLNVMRLEIPPVRKRRCDLPMLISHILRRLCTVRDRSVPRISEPAMAMLLNYDYPGNVRELENLLEHALIICQGEVIETTHFPLWLVKAVGTDAPAKQNGKKPATDAETAERERIMETLVQCRWNKGRAAQALKMDRTTLWRKLRKYRIN